MVEAADDICYRIIDFEDGIRIGLIDFRTGEELLKAVVGKDFDVTRYNLVTDKREKISYLRAKAINTLINACTKLFLEKEKDICDGKFDQSLIDILANEIGEPLNELHTISRKKIYQSKQVLEIEAAGFTIVAELLDLFITAVNDFHIHGKDLRKKRPYSEKIISLLPAQFLQYEKSDLYSRILRVCEFVAGMTDSYALTLFRKLKGIELPK